nr:carboxypeptidase-like regulatory domain-containing protein [uncultured Carboxylicivirga sp.]
MIRFKTIIFLFLITTKLEAQSYSGIIKNERGLPIEMASIIVKSKPIGTATNADGFFLFNQLTIGDTIVVSHLSYTTKEMIITNQTFIPITLTSKITKITEVLVSNLSAQQIVEKAIERLAHNYYGNNKYIEGFLRESVYKNDSLRAITEATLNVHLPSKPGKNGSVSVLRKRTLIEDDMNMEVINSPLVVLLMNEVYSHSSILERRALRNHNFKIENYKIDGANTYYKIGFEPKGRLGSKYFKGHMLINIEDYSFHNIEISNTSLINPTSVKTSYTELNGKYVLTNLQLEKTKLKNQISKTIKVSYATTNYQASRRFKSSKFVKGEVLRRYGNHYNINYWDGYRFLVPDSALLCKAKHLHLYDTPLHLAPESEKLYQPNINLSYSTQSTDDVEMLSRNLNSFNTLTSYTLTKGISKPIYSSMAQVLFISWLSIPFQGVEAERRILSFNGYTSSYNPFIFNGFYNSYCKGITDGQLSELKDKSISDFLRLHTVRYESNYNVVKKMEEELFVSDFLHRDKVDEFLDIYFLNYFIRRLYLSVPFFISEADIEFTNRAEQDMPVSTNRLKSYVKYLHRPDSDFNRTVVSDELSNTERSYLSTMKWLSSLNFFVGITNLLPAIRFNKSNHLRISGGYLPVPFGHQLEQNLYLNSNKRLTVLNLRQYLGKYCTGYSAGIRLLDQPLFKKVSITSQIDYWHQPSELSFFDKSLKEGFSVRQEICFKQKYFNFQIGYTLKTDGFIDYATSLESSSSAYLGLSYYFKQR